MNIEKNIIVENKSSKAFLLDLYSPISNNKCPVIIFAHGFKGFKDWGHWDLIGRKFVSAGFLFLKFNFSHNGTSLDHPTEFADLESFGQNNYSKELTDIDIVLDWLVSKQKLVNLDRIDLDQITLIGHSRGGGISIVKAAQDNRIKQVITWAAVSQLDYAWKNEAMINDWKEKGVYHIMNGRTKQEMPMYYQIYEDYKKNEEQLNVKKCAQKLNKPCLIIHGTKDPAVPLLAAQQLNSWINNSELFIIEKANHVFGGSHPYEKETLHDHAQLLVDKSIEFVNKNI